MRKVWLIILLFVISGCANFERQLADDLVKGGEVKLNRCEVEGFDYAGLDADLGRRQILKVMMIHGVGIHHPGYSRRIQENLANNMGLNVISRLPKNIFLLDPNDNKTPIGNLRITYWQNADRSKNMLFYELTWSEITTPYKKIIAFDTTEEYTKFRVPFNNMMKTFLDNALPDPLVYEIDPQNLILNSNRQAICWMLQTGWDNIPDNQAKLCRITAAQAVKGLENQNIAYITHSLGSKILMDTLTADADEFVAASKTSANNADFKLLTKKLQNQNITVFMLANQLPILQIGRPLPKVHNQINAYCSPNGAKYKQRIFKEINVVAFSDPNDLLSYAIPQDFADKYIDSRLCPRVTNVSVNVAPEISAFGVGIVNPIAAHTDYDNSSKVINLITHGTDNFNHDKAVDEQCRFILMKKDNKMY